MSTPLKDSFSSIDPMYRLSFAQTYTRGLSDRERLVLTSDLSDKEPCGFCFECNRDLAGYDQRHQEVQEHCPCGAVRWYFVTSEDYQSLLSSALEGLSIGSCSSSKSSLWNESTSSLSEPAYNTTLGSSSPIKEITIISGPICYDNEKSRVADVGAKFLDKMLVPVYGRHPDIEGYDVYPDRPNSAGNVLMHATQWNKSANLPAQCMNPKKEPRKTIFAMKGRRVRKERCRAKRRLGFKSTQRGFGFKKGLARKDSGMGRVSADGDVYDGDVESEEE